MLKLTIAFGECVSLDVARLPGNLLQLKSVSVSRRASLRVTLNPHKFQCHNTHGAIRLENRCIIHKFLYCFPGIDVNGSETRKRPLDSETELSETKRSHPGQGTFCSLLLSKRLIMQPATCRYQSTGSDGIKDVICHFLTHHTLQPKPLIVET